MNFVELGTLVKIKGGGTPDKSNPNYWGGSIPWASVKDFKSTVIENTIDTITEEGVKNSATNIIPAGSIIVPTRMAVGKAAINKIDMAINQDLKALFPSSKIDARFLFHCLLANAHTLEKQASGATVKGIKLDVLRGLQIPVISMSEQKRIAAILDQADAMRQSRRRAITRLNDLSQSIFYEMFESNRNKYGFKPLSKLGKVSTGSTPPSSKKEFFIGEIPFVTPGDLNSNEDIKRHLSIDGASKSRLVNAGATFVCCIGATIGKTDFAREKSAFNQQINAVEWNELITPKYGLFALRHKKEEIIFKGKGASTTLPILKKSEFEKIEIPVPAIKDQMIFENKIKKIEAHRLILEKNEKQLENLFLSLQQRAFRGEL